MDLKLESESEMGKLNEKAETGFKSEQVPWGQRSV